MWTLVFSYHSAPEIGNVVANKRLCMFIVAPLFYQNSYKIQEDCCMQKYTLRSTIFMGKLHGPLAFVSVSIMCYAAFDRFCQKQLCQWMHGEKSIYVSIWKICVYLNNLKSENKLTANCT
jgi:hypothetical protein